MAEPEKMIEKFVRDGMAKSTMRGSIIIVSSLLAHMTNVELIKLFGADCHKIRMEYQDLMKMGEEEAEEHRQEMSETEIKNWASLAEIRDAVNLLAKSVKNVYDFQRVVWYKMELAQTVRNEYHTLKVRNFNVDTDNYIERNGNSTGSFFKIVLNDFKTEGSLSRQEIIMSDPELVSTIDSLYQHRLKRGIDYLFVKQNGKKFENQKFATFVIDGLTGYLGGRRIGSQMLRKIVVTEFRHGEKTIKENKEFSQKMLHSAYMSERYRRIRM
ncbi:hypothetical protein BDK51DRAFT_45130 [Blyttiomyces helicus]|uniref:Uncharacterized protein n=1 Tax=Blyttiomyces helicus TaxID=388810 RepID=A0A4P9WQC7_9FUNG|nr:hypothetical protein BDK51DRAFT_45130 [Blyttiomyces helicus]|eukprot:RKO94008.1 hypothetical protein BDK51DRAFT_45130 [Blyttiomyces helicus]